MPAIITIVKARAFIGSLNVGVEHTDKLPLKRVHAESIDPYTFSAYTYFVNVISNVLPFRYLLPISTSPDSGTNKGVHLMKGLYV